MQDLFPSNARFDEICDRAARDVGAYRRRLAGGKQAFWKACAGARLAEMINNPDVTLNYLGDPDASLRLTAASLVAEYWPPNQLFVSACLNLALSDGEPTVRGAALAALLFKLHSFVNDPSGQFAKLMISLRRLEPPMSEQLGRDALKQVADTISWAEEGRLALRQRLAGEHLDEMLLSAAAAAVYLDNPIADLRRAALMVLYERWRAEFDIRDICMRMSRNDCDLDVRFQAQGLLAAAYSRTNDAQVGDFLARVVKDPSEPEKLRKDAYLSLFSLRSMPASRLLAVLLPDFRFPEDVDWQFVETFLR